MRKFLSCLLLTSVLVLPIPLVNPQQPDGTPRQVGSAQRKSDKGRKSSAATLLAQRGVQTISAAQMRDYLSFIASDELEGRDTPSRGLDTAAKFLAMNMSRWGLKPAGDNGTFFQRIELRKERMDAAQVRVDFNGRTLAAGTDFLPLAGSDNVTGQLVFAGNGWLVKAKNIDAYKGIDARGKIAIIVGSPFTMPRGITRADLTGKQGEDWLGVPEYARKQGVAGLIYLPEYQYLATWERHRQRLMERDSLVVTKFQAPAPPQLPSMAVTPQIANQIFQGEPQSAAMVFNAASGSMPFEPFALSVEKTLTMNLASRKEIIGTQNVVAVWEGSDPILKNEYVALGAHYDHVGVGVAVNGDNIYNGADDDASGTTALLAMAEALAKAPTRPKRSVLFVWHAGEEKGLWGSRYFTEYPTVPLEKIVTQINIDMIGRSKQPNDSNTRNRDLSASNEIYVIGSKMMSTELGDMTETVNQGYLNLAYNYRYDDPNDPNRFFFRSDHFNYARKGIPIVFYFDGEHEDYHRPGDSPDKIDYLKLEQVVRTVYMTLWEIAMRPTRPVVDKKLPAAFATGGD